MSGEPMLFHTCMYLQNNIACLKEFGIDKDGWTGRVVVNSSDGPVAVQGIHVTVDGRKLSIGNMSAPRIPQFPKRHSTLGVCLEG